jgi:hypothetical protein
MFALRTVSGAEVSAPAVCHSLAGRVLLFSANGLLSKGRRLIGHGVTP